MIRAEYVAFQSTGRGRLMAVYGSEVTPAELASARERLSKLPGVYSEVTQSLFDDGSERATLDMEVDPAGPTTEDTASALFKRLTDPKLPYVLLEADFTLTACKCGVIGLKRDETFLRGFKPHTSLSGELLRQAITPELISQYVTTKDHRPIIDELWRLYSGQGVHVMGVSLGYEVLPDCQH